MTNTVLILGPSGRFGRHTAEAFWNAGWQVRLFDRKSDKLPEAAMGVDLIINGWNPQYDRWSDEIPGLTAQVIEAAKASGATVMIPGNVYVYGADAPERFAAETPHGAQNTLGRIRREMERAYRDAGVKTIILRAGDFLDTEASGNWFDKVIAKDIAKGKMTYPGPLDRPHAWAYLPDLAKAAVEIAERREGLSTFADIPFPGYTLSGQDLHKGVETALGRSIKLNRMMWLPLYLVRPFWHLAKHLIEMRYLWSKPHHLDGSAFDAVLPEFVPTPLETALVSVLEPNIHPDKPVSGHRVAALAAE